MTETVAYVGSTFLSEVMAVRAEINRASVEKREPDYSQFHASTLEAAGVSLKAIYQSGASLAGLPMDHKLQRRAAQEVAKTEHQHNNPSESGKSDAGTES